MTGDSPEQSSVTTSLGKQSAKEREAYVDDTTCIHHKACAIANKNKTVAVEVSSVIGRSLILDIAEAIKNTSLSVDGVSNENCQEMLDCWCLLTSQLIYCTHPWYIAVVNLSA